MTRTLPLIALLSATVACTAIDEEAMLVVDPGNEARAEETVAVQLTIEDAKGPVRSAMVCDTGSSDFTCVTAPNGDVTLLLPAGLPSRIQVNDWNHLPMVIEWEAPEHDAVLLIQLLDEPEAASWDASLHELVVGDSPAHVELQADDAGELVAVRFEG